MAIANRNLEVGTRLVANYKKQTYVCTVEKEAEGEGLVFVLEDGRAFKSLSAAGSAVMGGKAVNGWRFWSLKAEATASVEPPPAEKPAKAARRKSRKLIYRVPNQQGAPEGKQNFFCAACMKGFLVETGTTPDQCPQGHQIADPELTGVAGSSAADQC